MNIILALVIFSMIILFHELGHFLLAKFNDVKVNEFCLGLGPTLVGFTKGETRYSLKLLPFGGACMMEGEDEASEDDRGFNNKTVLQRFSIVFAGPLFNFIMAFVFAVILLSCIGIDRPVVSETINGYSAQAAGMQKGDVIVKINQKKIHFYREVSMYTFFYPGETLEVTYQRNGEEKTAVIEPKLDEKSGRYMIGIKAQAQRERGGLLTNLKYGAHEVGYWIWTSLQSLKMLVTGKVSLNELSGPVGIVKTIGDTYDASKQDGIFYIFLSMLNFSILLSANLGVMNLLPLPALDGGRLIFLILEAVRKKRVDPEKEGMVHFVGIMILMGLMVLVMFNDIRKLFI